MGEEVGLSAGICARIVELVHGAAGYNVNVMGRGGLILGSSDPSRIGTVHEGAHRIMAGEVEEIAIDAEAAASMKGVRPGYNGAVRFEGALVACIGISGDPAITRPLQKMAEVVMQQELERERLREREIFLLDGMREQISDIAERMQILSLNGAIIAARLGDKGLGFKVVVSEMRKLSVQIGERIAEFGRRGIGQ